MQSRLGHLVVNIQPEHAGFYRDLFAFLNWTTIYDGDGMLGVGDANDVSFWFMGPPNEAKNDYDGPGVNHIAISVSAQSDVDEAVLFLKSKDVVPLFDTPRHRPDFPMGEGNTYYQVMFETPDRLLLEIVYTGPTSA